MKDEFQLLANFASQHKLKIKQDDCAEKIVAGKHGHIYLHSDSELGTLFMPAKTAKELFGKWCPKKWNNFKRAGLAAGMTLQQNGDTEGALSFDPANKTQAKLAIKIAGARAKRQQTAEQIAKFIAATAKSRFGRRDTVETAPLAL